MESSNRFGVVSIGIQLPPVRQGKINDVKRKIASSDPLTILDDILGGVLAGAVGIGSAFVILLISDMKHRKDARKDLSRALLSEMNILLEEISAMRQGLAENLAKHPRQSPFKFRHLTFDTHLYSSLGHNLGILPLEITDIKEETNGHCLFLVNLRK